MVKIPAGKHKSRSLRRINVKTPGGKTVIHHRKHKPSPAKCGKCGDILKGIARERPHKMKNMPKSQKKTDRPYGGNLCSRCTRRVMITKARS